MRRWVTVSFKAPPTLADALHAHVAHTGRSVSDVVREATANYLDGHGYTTTPTPDDPDLLAALEAWVGR